VQVALLRGVGRWPDTYGEAIYGTRPWQRAEGTTATGADVRFTHRAGDGRETIYAVLMEPQSAGPVTIKDLRVAAGATARDLATGASVALEQHGDALTLTLPGTLPDAPAHAVAIDQHR
jgi:alpha-L-fucosidase